MSAPEALTTDARLAALPSLPREGGEPVFAEPWQAQAFALAVRLSADGHFTWKEWTVALADELAAASTDGEPDDGSRYYHHWVAALERLVTERGLAAAATIETRKDAWAEAYRRKLLWKSVCFNSTGWPCGDGCRGRAQALTTATSRRRQACRAATPGLADRGH